MFGVCAPMWMHLVVNLHLEHCRSLGADGTGLHSLASVDGRTAQNRSLLPLGGSLVCMAFWCYYFCYWALNACRTSVCVSDITANISFLLVLLAYAPNVIWQTPHREMDIMPGLLIRRSAWSVFLPFLFGMVKVQESQELSLPVSICPSSYLDTFLSPLFHLFIFAGMNKSMQIADRKSTRLNSSHL